jgi:TatD DNase family protein
MLIDAHCHLDKYGDSVSAALRQINNHGIFSLSNSMDLDSFRVNLEIGDRCALVLPTFGVHPWSAPEYVDHLENLTGAIEQSPILGEIGLDRYFIDDASQYSAQREVFTFFLAAAKEQGKIVNLHTKGAEREVLDLLRQFGIERAIVHWYSGPLELIQEYLDVGAYFTIGVELLRSEHIGQIARALPLHRLLTETDNPGGYEWLVGEQGMPSRIKEVVHALAELSNTTPQEIAQQVQSNFVRLIEDDPHLVEVHQMLLG